MLWTIAKDSKCFQQNPNFIYDEACLDIINELDQTVRIMGRSLECHTCEPIPVTNIPAHSNTSVLVDTKFKFQMMYSDEKNNSCGWSQLLEEHYRYGWNISSKCTSLYIKEEADSQYLPILGALIVLFCFGTIWYMIKCIYKCTSNSSHVNWRRFFKRSEMESDLGSPLDGNPLIVEHPPVIRKHPTRVKSIDVFRGLCITIMIFVNYGGGKYWFFEHSIWNGLTIADLVFPWFLWIMGLSLTISVRSRLRRGSPRRQLFIHIIRRAATLILIGLVLNSHGELATLSSVRFPGVLQRIGVTYLIVGILESAFTKRSTIEEYGRFSCIKDILVAWPQWLFVMALVIVHTCLTFYMPVPSCGKGYLGPGGLEDNGKHFNCTGGAAGYIDRQVFGEHMYKNATCRKVYGNEVYFDPEGILGTMTAVFTVYLGVQAGRILHMYTSVRFRSLRWTAWAIGTGMAGLILTDFTLGDGGLIPMNKNLWSLSYVLFTASLAFAIQALLFFVVDIKRKWGGRPLFYPEQMGDPGHGTHVRPMMQGMAGLILTDFTLGDGGLIPMNKNLWSLSYVLFTASLAFAIQALLFFVVDIKRKWGGRPLFYPGMNAIFLYIGHELFRKTFPFAWEPLYKSHREYLVMNLWGSAIWVAISIYLYKKDIFFSV